MSGSPLDVPRLRRVPRQARTLAFPNYDGNGMYLSIGNLSRTPEVGLLFIDFERGRRLRVKGTATIDREDVPRGGLEPPVPAWKRSEWARDVLPRVP